MAALVSSDPLSVVEAAYDLVVSDSQWITRVTHAISPDISGPAGTVGYKFSRVRELRYQASAITVVRGYEELSSLTDSVVNTFPTRDLERFFNTVGITATSASCESSLPRASIDRGLVDFCGIVIGNARSGVVVGAPLAQPANISTAAKRCWRRVAAHLSTVYRLRGTLARSAVRLPEAVLTSGGQTVHAVGGAKATASQRLLRHAVLAMDSARRRRGRSDALRALSLWRELVAGRWTLVEQFEQDGRRLVFAHANPPDAVPLRELSPREASVVRLLRAGHRGRSVACLLGVSEGAVSQAVKGALRKLRVGSVSQLLQVAARLENTTDLTWCHAMTGCTVAFSASETRPEIAGLTAAERQILHLLLDGASNTRIAEIRGSAYRTIANQIAALYNKLGVSSRVELALHASRSVHQLD